jgi:hypothetical protein
MSSGEFGAFLELYALRLATWPKVHPQTSHRAFTYQPLNHARNFIGSTHLPSPLANNFPQFYRCPG